jgi:hypothetical protein
MTETPGAAEHTGCKAFLMQMDMPSRDAIVQRWEPFAGKKAERVEGAGKNAAVVTPAIGSRWMNSSKFGLFCSIWR